MSLEEKARKIKLLEEHDRKARLADRFKGIKGGRKPNLLKKYIKETNVTLDDLEKIIKSVIFPHTRAELQKIADDEDEPMAVRVLVRAYLKDYNTSAINNWNTLINRVYGFPKERMEHSGGIDVSNLSKEEVRAELDALLKKREEES